MVVYGVEIPGQEGKCGMAAIAQKDGSCLDFDKFSEYLKNNLASYTRPIFIRLVDSIEYTGSINILNYEYIIKLIKFYFKRHI